MSCSLNSFLGPTKELLQEISYMTLVKKLFRFISFSISFLWPKISFTKNSLGSLFNKHFHVFL